MLRYTAIRRIIVTGADGMGKSKLVWNLTERLAGPRIRFNGHEGGPIRDKQDAFTRMTRFIMNDYGIQDRSCMTDDPVYSTAFDRDQVINWQFYDEVLTTFLPIIVFCDNDHPLIDKTSKAHKDPELLQGVHDRARRIRELYHARMSDLEDKGLHVLIYNWRFDPEATRIVKRLTTAGALICAG